MSDAAAARNLRMSVLEYITLPSYFTLMQLIMGMDNIVTLVFNTTKQLDSQIFVYLACNAVLTLFYGLDALLATFSLGLEFFKSPAHVLDSFIIFGKAVVLLNMWFFGEAHPDYDNAYYATMILLTGLRLLLLSSQETDRTNILKAFQSGHMDSNKVKARIRKLQLSAVELEGAEDLLDQCTNNSSVVGPKELHVFLTLIRNNLDDKAADQITKALTQGLMVKIMGVTQRAPQPVELPHCMLTLRDEIGKAVSALKDRALLQRTVRHTSVRKDQIWNQTLYFEAVPSNLHSVKIEICENNSLYAAMQYTAHLVVPRAGMAPQTESLPLFGKDGIETRGRIAVESALYCDNDFPIQDLMATPATHMRSAGKKPAYGVVSVIVSTCGHWKDFWFCLLFGFFSLSVYASVAPLTAKFLQMLVDDALTPTVKTEKTQGILVECCSTIALLYFVGVLSNCGIGYAQSWVDAGATCQLRRKLLYVVLSQDSRFHQQNSEGGLGTLFGSDIAKVNELWSAFFWNLLGPLFQLAFAFGYLLTSAPNAAFMGFGFLAFAFSGGPKVKAAAKSLNFSNFNAIVTSEYANAVKCQKVIRSYGIKPLIMDRFDGYIKVLNASEFNSMFWASNMQQFVESLLNFFTTVETVALALLTYSDPSMTIGNFFALTQLYTSIIRPAASLGGFSRIALRNAGSLQRLDHVIRAFKEKPAPLQGEDLTEIKEVKGHSINSAEHYLPPSIPTIGEREEYNPTDDKDKNFIQIDDVVFGYDPARPVLKGVTMSISKGTYVCIVGDSGSGKSTLLSILMGFYKQDKGQITIDGIDIKQEFFRVASRVGVVFQEAMILNGTIYDNIAYGSPNGVHGAKPSRAECMEAAKAAGCGFITEKLKDGLDTIVGDGAHVSLSGGEQQRVCVARALARKPKLLLLDEATSALDPETEAAIIRVVANLRSTGMTIISVTHKLKTAMNADSIFVLSKGQMAEFGTFQELKNRADGHFARMLTAQNEDD